MVYTGNKLGKQMYLRISNNDRVRLERIMARTGMATQAATIRLCINREYERQTAHTRVRDLFPDSPDRNLHVELHADPCEEDYERETQEDEAKSALYNPRKNETRPQE